jgi:hypothetical protein
MSKKQYIGQSLSEYNPELTKELHPTKNAGIGGITRDLKWLETKIY